MSINNWHHGCRGLMSACKRMLNLMGAADLAKVNNVGYRIPQTCAQDGEKQHHANDTVQLRYSETIEFGSLGDAVAGYKTKAM